jgi:hypothetical protein
MEALQDKVKEFTRDGPPSVGQLIALNELAKKEGVKKNELDKLIEEAVAANKLVYETQRASIDDRPSFDRPKDVTFEKSRMDFPERRDLFDHQQTKQSTASDELMFNRPELTFGNVELDFSDSKNTASAQQIVVDPLPESETTSIDFRSVSEVDTRIDQKQPVEFTSIPLEHQLSYDQKISEIKSALEEINQVIIERGYPFLDEEYLNIQNQLYAKYGLPPLRSIRDSIVQQPHFDQPKIPSYQESTTPISPASDTHQFAQSQEEIERQLQIVKQKEEEKYKQKLEEKKLVEKQSKETSNRSTFEVSKSIGTIAVLGWIAAGVSILLFPLIGVIMGIVTLSKVKELERKVTTQNLVLAAEDVTKLKTARTIGLIAVFVGAGKLVFLWLNFGTIFQN